MDWSPHLEAGESLRWEGRPAPRCYTFRNWRHSLFGILLLFLTVYWQIVGFGLGRTYASPFIAWLPFPFLLASLYLSLGHLLLARIEWERTFYAVTDRRVLVLRGILRQRPLDLPLGEVCYFRLRPFAEELGSVSISASSAPRPLVLHCLEHPRIVTDLLEGAMAAHGGLAGGEID